MADDLSKNMKRTAHRVIDSYNGWDIDAMNTSRTADCVNEVLPRSMSREPRINEEYRVFFASIVSLFKGFNVGVPLTAHR